MRRTLAVVVAVLLVAGAFGLDADAKKRKRKPDFFYPTNAEVGGALNAAKDDTDPFNSRDDVISFEIDSADATQIGAVQTNLGKKGKNIKSLDNQLSLSYLFIDRTCRGGGPRVTLLVDENDDGQYVEADDAAVHGAIGNTDGGANGECGRNIWVTEDMTNAVTKWDASQIEPGAQVRSWDQVEEIVGSHRVMGILLVDDSGWVTAPVGGEDTSGCAYFDDLKFGPSKFKKDRDTVGTGGEAAAANDC